MDKNDKNNSPTRWTDGELNGQPENNSPKRWTGGELNKRLENNSPNGGTYGELISSPNGWKSK